MSDPRARVLADIRAALRRTGPLPDSVAQALEDRLKRPGANLKPAIGVDPIAQFIEKIESVHGRVSRVAGPDKVSEVVSAHLERFSLPLELVVAPDPALEDVVWSNRLAIARRNAGADDRVSVTAAYAGVAETGSLVMLSSAHSPTTLNFLPDDHIIVVREADVVPHIEDVWERMRRESRGMPRTVNFITGPSKTGDIEQTIQEGAHGPRRLHVVLLP